MNEAGTPKHEIEHRTIKLIVGLIALSLAPLTAFLASAPLDSISAAYYDDGRWTRDVFVGFLFAIAAFLLCYNGYSPREAALSKIAAIAAALVALMPCECGGHDQLIAGLHGLAAAVMFTILAFFCWLFSNRAREKVRDCQYQEAQRRVWIYQACLVTIVVAMATVAAARLTGLTVEGLVFWCEASALVAFGLSWLIASRLIPGLAAPAERKEYFPGGSQPGR